MQAEEKSKELGISHLINSIKQFSQALTDATARILSLIIFLATLPLRLFGIGNKKIKKNSDIPNNQKSTQHSSRSDGDENDNLVLRRKSPNTPNSPNGGSRLTHSHRSHLSVKKPQNEKNFARSVVNNIQPIPSSLVRTSARPQKRHIIYTKIKSFTHAQSILYCCRRTTKELWGTLWDMAFIMQAGDCRPRTPPWSRCILLPCTNFVLDIKLNIRIVNGHHNKTDPESASCRKVCSALASTTQWAWVQDLSWTVACSPDLDMALCNN